MLVDNTRQKINIVCSGGEMKGGFVSGLLGDMFEAVDMNQFSVTFYCVSASVPSVLYYLSHNLQAPRKEIWIEELSKEARRIKNGFFRLDVESIINVFKSHPFIVDNILNNKDEIIFPIFNVDTKKVELVSNKKRQGYIYLGDYDIYTLVKAAISAPLIYGRTVRVGLFDYCDPGMVDHFLIPENENKTIFILQNKNFMRDKFVFLTLFVYSFFDHTKIPYFFFARRVFHKKNLYKKVKSMVKSGWSILLEPKNKLRGELNKHTTRKELLFNFKQGQKVFSKNKDKILSFLLK